MRKLAFVVGISNYPDNQLDNPANDADSIADAFFRLGIESIKIKNAEIVEIKDRFDEYLSRLNAYEVALIFFAGHGMEIEGENYLCAVNTDFSSLNRIQYSSLALSYIIHGLEQTDVYTKIVILDACRDNPFERRLRGIPTSGLAPVFAPLGTIIAFATSPGQVASDGRNGNGAYTYSLLQHIFTNDLKIEEMFKRARNTLYALTLKRQLSWEHTSLMGDFYFSISTLTGEFISNYSADVIADASYNYTVPNPFITYINELRSHDWNRQNPAIARFHSQPLNEATKDILFLLGRNIYQAGVGPAWNASSFLDSIQTNIRLLGEEIKYHLLNGMLFEIYFNHDGILRDEFKSEKIDIIYSAVFEDPMKQSVSFIAGKLQDYQFRILFNPLIDNVVTLSIICEQYRDDIYRIIQIQCDGRNVLYYSNGVSEYVPDDSIILLDRNAIKKVIVQKTGIPTYKLNINFVNIPESIDRICIPYEFKLLKYPIRSQATTS